MAAYVISEVEVLDQIAMERYRALAADSIDAHGGRYLVRGGAAETVEGSPPPKTIIIVEFSSMAQARLNTRKPCGFAAPLSIVG